MRVVTAVPTVTLDDARAFVTRAARGPALQQLSDHLAAHPDALTSGASTAPLGLQTLAALLTEAGHDTVRCPTCLRCGSQKPLRNRVDGGRVCNRCAYQARRASCTGLWKGPTGFHPRRAGSTLMRVLRQGPKERDLREMRRQPQGVHSDRRRCPALPPM
jgi:hypothetical protein